MVLPHSACFLNLSGQEALNPIDEDGRRWRGPLGQRLDQELADLPGSPLCQGVSSPTRQTETCPSPGQDGTSGMAAACGKREVRSQLGARALEG